MKSSSARASGYASDSARTIRRARRTSAVAGLATGACVGAEGTGLAYGPSSNPIGAPDIYQHAECPLASEDPKS
ncbi:hypothetical protein GCM10029964_000900 [Kibdelosporangium lantanae]